ncbi:10882_t:CDS:2 [Funneliformis caledonium]|uniref:10882_t:CDS:1 n=1 Tax=Funneliformis caledonium TaxID=1117310 RepID=A0A9N9H4F1_9GLOM|nr:10882_t:CDS:2 [Funneliformis caledonium]
MATFDDEINAISKALVRMSDDDSNSNELKKFRKLWWDQGNLHPKAYWVHAK